MAPSAVLSSTPTRRHPLTSLSPSLPPSLPSPVFRRRTISTASTASTTSSSKESMSARPRWRASSLGHLDGRPTLARRAQGQVGLASPARRLTDAHESPLALSRREEARGEVEQKELDRLGLFGVKEGVGLDLKTEGDDGMLREEVGMVRRLLGEMGRRVELLEHTKVEANNNTSTLGGTEGSNSFVYSQARRPRSSLSSSDEELASVLDLSVGFTALRCNLEAIIGADREEELLEQVESIEDKLWGVERVVDQQKQRIVRLELNNEALLVQAERMVGRIKGLEEEREVSRAIIMSKERELQTLRSGASRVCEGLSLPSSPSRAWPLREGLEERRWWSNPLLEERRKSTEGTKKEEKVTSKEDKVEEEVDESEGEVAPVSCLLWSLLPLPLLRLLTGALSLLAGTVDSIP